MIDNRPDLLLSLSYYTGVPVPDFSVDMLAIPDLVRASIAALGGVQDYGDSAFNGLYALQTSPVLVARFAPLVFQACRPTPPAPPPSADLAERCGGAWGGVDRTLTQFCHSSREGREAAKATKKGRLRCKRHPACRAAFGPFADLRAFAAFA